MLERYVDHYIAKYETTIAPIRKLIAEQNVLFTDDAKVIQRAKKNIDTMTDASATSRALASTRVAR